ncbi:MAG: oligosaccharide flippase family protein [Ignavibacteriales bacterium]|nr:oligosaccharide flippase family protein [Ignavibacteriales bacterium]
MATNVLNPMLSFFSKGHARTLRAKRNISVAFITKLISMLISFLVVPITLNYVDSTRYGIWIAISTIIHWFAFMDVGLGNGLRNKLAEALAVKDIELGKTYVSSSFALLSLISILLFIVFLIIALFVDWNRVLNTSIVSNKELFFTVVTVFFFFCVNFILKITMSINAAMQKYSINNIIGLSGSVFGLAAIYLLVKTTDGSLYKLCLVYGSKQAIVLLGFSIYLFNTSLKKLKPSLKYVNFKIAIPLTKLGFKFFIAQILYMFKTQIGSIIIIQFFGPEDVTIYNLSKKYVMITSMIYTMVLTPFLSAFTEAYTIKEYDWIKNIIKKMRKIWAISAIVTLLMAVVSPFFFDLWLGNKVLIPQTIVFILALSSIIGTWSATYTLFLNGIGKVKLQLYMLTIQALALIPLSYLFFWLGAGISSVILPKIILGIVSSFIFTKQYQKIIGNNARGLWAK